MVTWSWRTVKIAVYVAWFKCATFVCCKKRAQRPPAHTRRQWNVLVLGFGGVGKTFLLERMKALSRPSGALALADEQQRGGLPPTQGFRITECPHGARDKFCLWEIGGNERIRPYWGRYATSCSALVFCIAAAVSAGIDAVDAQLDALCVFVRTHGRLSWPVAVLVCKQDLAGMVAPCAVAARVAVKYAEHGLADRLGKVKTFGCSARPAGVADAAGQSAAAQLLWAPLNWLSQRL